MDEHSHLNFYMYTPGKGLGPAFPLEKVHLKTCSYLQRSFLHLMPSPFSCDVEDLSSRNELEKCHVPSTFSPETSTAVLYDSQLATCNSQFTGIHKIDFNRYISYFV